MGFCQRRNWQFRLRLTCDTFIRTHRQWIQLRALKFQKGERRFFANVYFTKQRKGPFQLACYWAPDEDEPWFIATCQVADGQTIREYGKRFWIEAMFRDFKSQGFELEATRLRDKRRLVRRVLVLVLCYLWVAWLGMRCIRCGKRSFFEKGKRRTLSVIQLGLDYFHETFFSGRLFRYALPRFS